MQLHCTLELGRGVGHNQVSTIRSCYPDHSRLQDKNSLWTLSHTSSEVSGQVQTPQDMGSSISTHPGGAGSVWVPEEGSPHSLHLHLLQSHRWRPAFPVGLAAPHSQQLHWYCHSSQRALAAPRSLHRHPNLYCRWADPGWGPCTARHSDLLALGAKWVVLLHPPFWPSAMRGESDRKVTCKAPTTGSSPLTAST